MKEDLVVITGGTSGLGLELVKLFHSKGKNVLVISRTKRKEMPKVIYEYGSVGDEAFIKDLYKKYAKKFNISYLINNASIGLFGVPETNILSRINAVFEANLTGLILNTTYALPLMKQKGGRIVNIISTAGLKGNVNESLYCASKHGARGFTESLKATFKGSNIKVIGVYPGGMNTEFWSNSRDYVSVEKSSTWLNPKNVAKVIFDNITNDTVNVADITIERK